jgi:hypothetical protein
MEEKEFLFALDNAKREYCEAIQMIGGLYGGDMYPAIYDNLIEQISSIAGNIFQAEELYKAYGEMLDLSCYTSILQNLKKEAILENAF